MLARRKIWSLLIIVSLLAVVFSGIDVLPRAGAETWDGPHGWLRYRDIYINETGGGDPTYDQVFNMTLCNYAGTDWVTPNYTFFLGGWAQSDFDDLRFECIFVNSEFREMHLSHFTQTLNATVAKVWVRLPKMNGGEQAVIRMYYANPSAQSTSQIAAVFDYGNNFEHKDEDWFSQTYCGFTGEHPAVIELQGGGYRMYYNEGPPHYIKSRESADGITWGAEVRNYINGSDNDYSAMYCDVLELENGTLLMVYAEGVGPLSGINVSLSTNGRDWTDYGEILATGAPGAWDDAYLYDPDISYINGTWYLFYGGRPNAGSFVDSAIGLATCANWWGPFARVGVDPMMQKTTWNGGRNGTARLNNVANADLVAIGDDQYVMWWTYTNLFIGAASDHPCTVGFAYTDLIGLELMASTGTTRFEYSPIWPALWEQDTTAVFSQMEPCAIYDSTSDLWHVWTRNHTTYDSIKYMQFGALENGMPNLVSKAIGNYTSLEQPDQDVWTDLNGVDFCEDSETIYVNGSNTYIYAALPIGRIASVNHSNCHGVITRFETPAVSDANSGIMISSGQNYWKFSPGNYWAQNNAGIGSFNSAGFWKLVSKEANVSVADVNSAITSTNGWYMHRYFYNPNGTGYTIYQFNETGSWIANDTGNVPDTTGTELPLPIYIESVETGGVGPFVLNVDWIAVENETIDDPWLAWKIDPPVIYTPPPGYMSSMEDAVAMLVSLAPFIFLMFVIMLVVRAIKGSIQY